MTTQDWVNTGSGNGLLPHSTKPLTEPVLTYHQWGQAALAQQQSPESNLTILTKLVIISKIEEREGPNQQTALTLTLGIW